MAGTQAIVNSNLSGDTAGWGCECNRIAILHLQAGAVPGRNLQLAGQLEISPRDSAGLEVQNGDTVTLTSPSGSITRKVRIDNSLSAGHLFVPTGYSGNDAMNLLPLTDITGPGSPGWKTVGVKIKKV